ncbi:hypothetical protein NDU88_004773 [Pleurodeles waltl]|uniref:Uncharacterized protein n=1 Tax=Pleurodeles waltl TaxID=8319 RepID=A0AAV7VHZ9_PLEWA|nr:hypothetical protein NDU88_004773 [Pleurodeles waltl]
MEEKASLEEDERATQDASKGPRKITEKSAPLEGEVRSTRGREEGEDQEVGGPNQGQQEQTPGSRARQPATLQEKHGRVTCVEVARIMHSPGSHMMNADFLSRYPAPERHLLPLYRGTACDGPDWVGPHCSAACAGASPADPEVFRRPTNRDVPRQLQCENGPLNGLASRCRGGRQTEERRTRGRRRRRRRTWRKTRELPKTRAKDLGRSRSSPLHSRTGGGRRPGSRWPRSGTARADSGEQSATARHASGEAWQSQVCGSGQNRDREDGRAIIKAHGLEGTYFNYKDTRVGGHVSQV